MSTTLQCMLRPLVALPAALGCAALAAPAAAADPAATLQQDQQMPRTLVIAYRTGPAQRPAFRRYLIEQMAPRLRALEAAHQLEDFRILYSWYRQPNVWDATIALRFPDAAALKTWNERETTMPGGLDGAGLALADPVASFLVDLTWSAKPDDLRPGAIYYVIPYSYQNEEEYRSYVEGYVLPQFAGWMKDGALIGYEIYMNRYPVGDPWDALFIQHYRDVDSFGRRQAVSAATRETLKGNVAWKAWSDRKGGIRSETENTIAELIAH